MNYKWVVDSDTIRLSTFVRKKAEGTVRMSDIEWSIEHNRCQVNGRLERFLSRRVVKGDSVEIQLQWKPRFFFEKERVLYEDEEFLIYNKPAALATESLAALLKLFIVHRLDRDTTGVIFFAKDKKSQHALDQMFRKREISKHYLALVKGTPKEPSGTIEAALGKIGEREGAVKWGVVTEDGKASRTDWVLKKRVGPYSLLQCIPFTGRTHQVRIHLCHLGHPIVGDAEYGGRKVQEGKAEKCPRPLLHAESVQFSHPTTLKQLHIVAPLPNDLLTFLNRPLA